MHLNMVLYDEQTEINLSFYLIYLNLKKRINSDRYIQGLVRQGLPTVAYPNGVIPWKVGRLSCFTKI